MSRGQDTGNHPGRQVGPHLSPHWRSVPEGNWTGPLGSAYASLGPNDFGTSMSAWAGPEGHHAEVESEASAGMTGRYMGIENTRFVAGPYRTQARAQIAAESLGKRVDTGRDASQYEKSRYTEVARNPRWPN